MNTPKAHKAIVTNLTWQNDKILALTLNTQETSFSFIPGQFISLKIDENTYRSYSIAGDYTKVGEIYILVAAGHDGMGANYVRNLKINDSVDFVGPSGRFKLAAPIPDKLIFLATGTGIAPFLAFLYQLKNEEYKGKIDLYFGLRNETENLCLDTLEAFKKDLSFDFFVWYSQKQGRVTVPAQKLTDKDAHYYLCGHPDMVSEINDILLKNGVEASNIFFEKFTRSVV